MSVELQEKRRTKKSTYNNFDLIRLFAASQVAITHSAEHLNIHFTFLKVLGYFPGVPIFFFISGYLIYKSFANLENNRLKVFFTNRFLRLYPALYLCFFLTLASIYFSGYFQHQSLTIKQFAIWALSQLTFLQFYNPPFLREYGVGAINGSLWTIAVELQFYILTPLLYFVLTKQKKIIAALFVLLILANMANTFYGAKDTAGFKLLGVSFVPWFYMFILGAYVSTSNLIQSYVLRVNPVVYLLLYVISYYVASEYDLGTGNGVNLVSYILLSCLVLKCAYTKPSLSRQLLNSNDISYGVYIYHMPIVNLLLFYKFNGTVAGFIIALAATALVAIFSWFYIEKPSLKLKKMALRKYN